MHKNVQYYMVFDESHPGLLQYQQIFDILYMQVNLHSLRFLLGFSGYSKSLYVSKKCSSASTQNSTILYKQSLQ